MTESQQTMLGRLKEIQENQTEMWTSYWQQYSVFCNLAVLGIGCIVYSSFDRAFFRIDKRKALLLGFMSSLHT